MEIPEPFVDSEAIEEGFKLINQWISWILQKFKILKCLRLCFTAFTHCLYTQLLGSNSSMLSPKRQSQKNCIKKISYDL